METKKKFYGGLKVFLSLLFIILLGLCSTSYASMSEGYLDYIITTLHDNYKYSNSTALANFKSNLNNITQEQKIVLLNKINEYMDQQGISNLQDRNIFCTASIPTLKFFITNNGAPGSTNNLDFYCIAWNYIKKYTSASNEYIYQINVNVSDPTTISTFRFPDQASTYSGIDIDSSNSSISSDGTVITSSNVATCGVASGFQTVPLTNYSSSNKKACILKDVNGGYVVPTPTPTPTPEITTGTITNPSGDVTGQIDLSGIEHGIGNIQNQISGDTQKVIENQNQNTETIVNTISGEVGKITNTLTNDANDIIDNTIITSGDIENALGFEIVQDPYSNFWTTLTNNLKNALLGTKRSIYISFQGRTWTISLDEYMVLPAWLTIILIPFSTAFFTWVLVCQWKHIFDKLSSGNIDSILKENSEERYF